MNQEEVGNQIIFRRRVVSKEGVLPYDIGNYFKSGEELQSASLRSDVLPIVNEHFGTVKGYALKPEFGAEYRGGKVVRDLHFIKDKLTEEELQLLKEQQKVELSMGYETDIINEKGQFNGEPIDGEHKNIKFDHIAWTWQGRARENDGVGLRVSDSMIYDSVVNETDNESEDDCVKRKIAIIKKENKGLAHKDIVARAISHCRKSKKKKPEKKTEDSIVSDPNVDGTENTDQETPDQPADYDKQFTDLNSKIDELKSLVSQGTEPNEEEQKEETEPAETKIEQLDEQTEEPEVKQETEKIDKIEAQISDLTSAIMSLTEIVKGVQAEIPKSLPREVNLAELRQKQIEAEAK